jgi:hypothetical protein
MSWSARAVLGGVVAVGLVACEAPTPSGQCGGFVCGGEERCDQETLTCVPDQAPVVTLVVPTGVVTSETFTVTGTVTDDVGATAATKAIVGVASEALELGDDGSFTFTVPTPLEDERSLELEVTATDGARTGRATATVRFDRVGPALELVAPLPGVTVAGETAQVQVRATDASQALEGVTVAGVALTAPMHGEVLAAAVPVPASSNGDLVDVTVTARDGHGNETTNVFAIRADRVGPSLTLASPSASEVLNAATWRVTGAATDPTPPVLVRVTQFDGGVASTTAALDGGAWEVELEVPQLEAMLPLRVEVEDAVGNVAELTRTVRVDRVAPTVSITWPAADSLRRQDFAVSALTGGDATTVTARLGSGAAVTLAGGPTSWTGQVAAPTQDYGPLTLEVTAADQAGNSASAQLQVLVDSVAPAVTFTAPVAGRKLNIADFASTTDVTVSWQVQDADTQASVSTVNGSASAATSLVVSTSDTDNGRVVTTTVTATDRAGNVGSASHAFSVDRVRPTITAWTPAVNARNVEPRVTSISFSERVTGATTSTDALVLAPATPGPGSWDGPHTTWTSAALEPYQVYESQLATLADDHGNEVIPGGRTFHTAGLAASSPAATPLATNVAHFRAAGDNDGLVAIALRHFGGPTEETFKVHLLSPRTLTLEAPLTSATAPLDYGINGWNRINPGPVTSLVQFAWVSTYANPAGPVPLHARGKYFSSNGGGTSAPVEKYITQMTGPSMTNEVVVATAADTDNSTYYRVSQAVPLPFSPSVHIAQSTDSSVAYRLEADRVRWTRIRANRDRLAIPNTTFYSATEFAAPVTAPSELSAAMNPGGQCLVTLFDSGSTTYGVFQPLGTCDVYLGAPGCPNNTSLTPVARPYKTRVAPFHANGENTILAAWKNGGSLYLGKMTNPSTCTDAFTSIGQPIAVGGFGKFEPVQLGNKAALLYVDANDALRVYVP